MLTSADIDELFGRARRYRPTTVVSARQLTAPLVWHTSRGARLRAEPGDWELIDGDGDRWTITASAFGRSYRQQPDGRYAKHEIVEAVQLDRAFEVPTTEGASTGRAGDWLVRDAAGAVWPAPDDTFRHRYRRAEPARCCPPGGSGPDC